MKIIASAISALLLTSTASQALPCAESYSEYSEKLELMGFTKESCPKETYLVDKDKYNNVCVMPEIGANWVTATAFWATPRDWKYAEKERAGQVFGFTLLYAPPVGFCVPPNMEVKIPFTHPASFPSYDSKPQIGFAVAEAFKNWIHPSRTIF